MRDYAFVPPTTSALDSAGSKIGLEQGCVRRLPRCGVYLTKCVRIAQPRWPDPNHTSTVTSSRRMRMAIGSWDASGSVGVSSMIDVEHVDDAFGFVDAIPDSVFASAGAPLTRERRT